MAEWRKYWDERVELAPREEIKRADEAKLRRQLQYVYERSPFYRRKFDQAGVKPESIRTVEDLAALPFTEKDELRRTQEEHPPLGEYQCASLTDIIRIQATSGTTGMPLFLGLTRHDADLWAEVGARTIWCMGFRPDDMMMACGSYFIMVSGVSDHLAGERASMAMVPIGVGRSAYLVRFARFLGVNALGGTPSYMLYLPKVVREELGIEPYQLGIRKILVGGEPGGSIPATRQEIEETWGARVVDGLYGMADVVSSFAGECEVREGLHFCGQGAVIPELINPESGENLPFEDDVVGEAVYTGIDREATPVVRYRSHDLMRVINRPCDCGRTSYRFEVLGRSDEMFIVKGVNIFCTAIEKLLGEMRPRLTGEFQVLLDRPSPLDIVRLRVEYGEGVAEEALPELQGEVTARLRKDLMCAADVELCPPASLPRFEYKAKRMYRVYQGDVPDSPTG